MFANRAGRVSQPPGTWWMRRTFAQLTYKLMNHLGTINIPLADTGQGKDRALPNNTKTQISCNEIKLPEKPGLGNMAGR